MEAYLCLLYEMLRQNCKGKPKKKIRSDVTTKISK